MQATRWPGSAAFALLAVMAACKGHSSEQPSAKEPMGSAAGVTTVRADAAAVGDVAADAAATASGSACVPGGPIAAAPADGGRIRICGDTACIDVDPATGVAQSAAHVKLDEPALAAAKVEEQGKKIVACFKDKCRDIGKAARDVIARDPDVHNDKLAATTDLRGLVIPKVAPQLWDIAGDHEIHLRSPGGQKDLSDMRPVGNHIYAVWLPGSEAVYTRSGQLVSPLSSGDTKFAMLDDSRSVALTPEHRVVILGDAQPRAHVIDLTESIGYADWLPPTALTVLADQTVVVVASRKGGEASVVLIDPQRGTVFRRWPLPVCPG